MRHHHAQFAAQFRLRKRFQNTPALLTHTDDTTSNISYWCCVTAPFSTSPLNKYFQTVSHIISLRTHSNDTTLSCSQSYSPVTQSPASGSQVLNCSPNRTTNPKKLQYCTASKFPIPGNWNVWPIHWQRYIPLRFTPCSHYSTNRKNAIKCVCGL
jgi:hypothetical protein